MDTAWNAYDWANYSKKSHEKYIVVNLNKNGEQFAKELMEDIGVYTDK